MATNPWINEIARINNLIKLTQANIARDQALLAANPNSVDATRLRTQIESGQNYLVDLRSELATFTAEYNNYNAVPNESSGQVVAGEQQAKSPGAVVQNPSTPAGTETVVTNTVQSTSNVETGTDGRVRTLNETQSTPQPASQPFALRDEDDNPLPPTPSLNGGVGARPDDSPSPTSASVQQTINANFNQRIDPRPNILGDYASYTYSISWYLLSPEQFNQLSLQSKKNISGWQLLMQSAGAPVVPANGGAGRNEYFSNDYYLDNFTLEMAYAGKGTSSPTQAANLSFTVTEPNGFTLLENLARAVTSFYQKNNVSQTTNNSTIQNQNQNGDADAQEGGFYGNSPSVDPRTTVWTNAQYCMVIRFYGYNQLGELVQVGKRTNPSNNNTGSNATDKNAVVEKFIPWVITGIDTKLNDRTVEYQVSGVGTPYIVALSSQRGTIPYNYELVGATVGEILNGRPSGTQYRRVSDGRVDSAQPPAIANATSRDGLATTILSGGSIDPETGSVGYATGA
jgi:hypothetical protein